MKEGRREGVPAGHWRELEDAPVPMRVELPKRFYLASKNKREGIAFICPDAVKVLIDSLREREEKGETITRDTPVLLVYDAIVEVPGKGQLHTTFTEYHPVGSQVVTKQPRKDSIGTVRVLPAACKVVRITPTAASSSTLEYDMQQTRAKAGITHGSEERPPSPHSLRKFLQTALDVSGVNTTMSNVILGHSNAIREHYSGRVPRPRPPP